MRYTWERISGSERAKEWRFTVPDDDGRGKRGVRTRHEMADREIRVGVGFTEIVPSHGPRGEDLRNRQGRLGGHDEKN